MRRAREVILMLAPEDLNISLSTCYNYTQNFKEGTYQARRHHSGQNVNANISLHVPPRTGVQQKVINLHWTTANVNLYLDKAATDPSSFIVDSKDAKSIVSLSPAQKQGKTWKRIELLDHDWNQSRQNAVTPMTHLFVETIFNIDNTPLNTGNNIFIRTKRTGQAVTLLNLSFYEPETVFQTMNEFLLLMTSPALDHIFRNPDTGKLKEDLLFVVDNGPSEAPANPLVQICLVRLLRLLGWDKIGQISFAEYHSKRNPVEGE